jgi:hypothetical protein
LLDFPILTADEKVDRFRSLIGGSAVRAPVLAFILAFGGWSACQADDGYRLFRRPQTESGPEGHTNERSGNPQNTSCLAIPGIEKHEGPGLIGGSRLIHGDGPQRYDGTFGWDYQGFGWHPGRVFLGWSHDRQHQPKLGPYKTDTHNVPDPVSLHPIRRLLEPRDP